MFPKKLLSGWFEKSYFVSLLKLEFCLQIQKRFWSILWLQKKLSLQIRLPVLILPVHVYALQVVHLRTVEIEAERDVQLRSMELESLCQKPVPPPHSCVPSSPVHMQVVSPPESGESINAESRSAFDVTKHIKLVQPFSEAEVDSYFVAFDCVAGKLGWPKDLWGLLLQCNLSGKAQQVCSALPVEKCLDYNMDKAAVLRAYGLVHEAYRQHYRSLTKTVNQTFVEFAQEKKNLFEKWCVSSKIMSFEQLQELIIL